MLSQPFVGYFGLGGCRQKAVVVVPVLWVTSEMSQLQPSPVVQRVHRHEEEINGFREKGGFWLALSPLFGQALVADFAPFAALFREVLDAWDAVCPQALGRRAEGQAALRRNDADRLKNGFARVTGEDCRVADPFQSALELVVER